MPGNPKHHVFFLHGIGTHSKNWIEDEDINGISLKQKLEDAWREFLPGLQLNEQNLSDHLDLISLHYDDFFTDLYDRWSTSINSLQTTLGGNPAALAALKPYISMANAIVNGQKDNQFFYTHALDTLFYIGNGLIQDAIISKIADQIFSVVRAHYKKDGHTFSIVAHSLGTAVIHKVLQILYSNSEKDLGKQLGQNLKFRVLLQVANTSYILSSDRATHYASVVKPSLIAGAGVCLDMINVSNRFDPVSELIPFDPPLDTWIDSSSRPFNVYTSLRPDRINHPNVHSIVHYFDNPMLSSLFFEKILQTTISEDVKSSAWQKYVERSPEVSLKQLRVDFLKMINGEKSSLIDFVSTIKNYYTLLG